MLKPYPPKKNKGITYKGRNKRYVKRNKNNIKSFCYYRNGSWVNISSKKNNKNFINKNCQIDENKVLKELLPSNNNTKAMTKDRPLLVTKKSKKNIKKEVNNYFNKFKVSKI